MTKSTAKKETTEDTTPVITTSVAEEIIKLLETYVLEEPVSELCSDIAVLNIEILQMPAVTSDNGISLELQNALFPLKLLRSALIECLRKVER